MIIKRKNSGSELVFTNRYIMLSRYPEEWAEKKK